MNNIEYFKAAVALGYPNHLSWIESIFMVNKSNNDWFEDGKFKLGDEFVTVDGLGKDKPLVTVTDELEIDDTILKNVNGSVKTTVGRVIGNFYMTSYATDNVVQFWEDNLDFNNIIKKEIIHRVESGELPVNTFDKLAKAKEFMSQFGHIIVLATTDKLMRPPTGIDSYKKQLKNELIKKYGKDAFKSEIVTNEYLDKLKKFDKEFLQDDIDKGSVLLSGKILNQSRAANFLAVGIPSKLGDEEGVFIDKTLNDGIDTRPEALVAQYNEIISASYSRGASTQLSGVLAAILTRSTQQYLIDKEDCKTDTGITVEVNKDNANALSGQYKLDGTLIEDGKTMIGKTIVVRSPIHCKANGYSYCKRCMGKYSSGLENGIVTMAAGLGGALMGTKLKLMHVTSVPIFSIHPQDLIT